MDNILVVCIGNICRSPIAEAMLKAEFPQKKIESAGIGALVGRPADPLSVQVAQQRGLDLSGHRAQQLTSKMCTQADLILVMETAHKRELEQQYPLARGKIHCLGDCGSAIPLFQIEDPYRLPIAAFETAYAAIEVGVKHWVGRIKLLS